MRAVICRAWGAVADLTVEDIASPPQPGPGEVLIAVKATAVNYADALRVVLPAVCRWSAAMRRSAC
jgi:NADPH:quinone reductase-like Zn-dependent oxidoreductase